MSSQPQPLEEIQTSSPWTEMTSTIFEGKLKLVDHRKQILDEYVELSTQKGDLVDLSSGMKATKRTLETGLTSEIPEVVQTSEECLSILNEAISETSSKIQEIETRISDLEERLAKINQVLMVYERTFSPILHRGIQSLPLSEWEWRCQYCFNNFTIPCRITIPDVPESSRSCCIDCVRAKFQLNINPKNRDYEVYIENHDEHSTVTPGPIRGRNASNTYCSDENVAKQMDDFVQENHDILESHSVELFECKCGRRFDDRTSLLSHKRGGTDPCQLSTRKCRRCNKFVSFDTLTTKTQAYHQWTDHNGTVICASCETPNTLF
jgi:hypothetical protein